MMVELAEDFRRKANILFAFIRWVHRAQIIPLSAATQA
jgi:hypothetical protein